ncbi:MAG: hypothetical protein CL920_38225 [Deltaproteobacteria bacterium]|nr:hypothetical protein [Deltaproteobacteria bacterium]MBU49773.1 hypothetical protein [Deltaproteobacteria bacterium]MBU54571.1 hypothetical protein [Deltaproteobacteria bacterium]|tara:strand:- start:4373 stop:5608 length:1236 start_codon:yes stop_codon:yes gene_type:complete
MQPHRQERSRLFSEAYREVESFLTSTNSLSEESTKTLLETLQTQFPTLRITEGWLLSSIKQLQRQQQRLTRPRTPDEWDKIFPRYPIEADGFARAFTPNQEEDIRETMKHYGLVVIHVFDEATCERAKEAMFEELNSIPNPRRQMLLSPEKPESWEACNWPSERKFLLSDPAFHQVAFDNATHETIHRVYAHLWQEERLMVSIDRWGIARGTKGLRFPQPDGTYTTQDRADWQLSLSKHWDYNPWLFVQERKQGIEPGYQGFVAFADHDIETGCHLTLPGGANFLKQWCLENEHPTSLGMKRRSYRPKENDPILQHMQPIPVRQGDMLIWSWGQLHSTTPNDNHKMRLHQYIRMFPAPIVNPQYAHQDNFSPKKILHQYRESTPLKDIQLSPLGQTLLGYFEENPQDLDQD